MHTTTEKGAVIRSDSRNGTRTALIAFSKTALITEPRKLIPASRGRYTTQFQGGFRPSYQRPAYLMTVFRTLPMQTDITMICRYGVWRRKAHNARHTSAPMKTENCWSRSHWRRRGPTRAFQWIERKTRTGWPRKEVISRPLRAADCRCIP